MATAELNKLQSPTDHRYETSMKLKGLAKLGSQNGVTNCHKTSVLAKRRHKPLQTLPVPQKEGPLKPAILCNSRTPQDLSFPLIHRSDCSMETSHIFRAKARYSIQKSRWQVKFATANKDDLQMPLLGGEIAV
jgi:hypothetical protein